MKIINILIITSCSFLALGQASGQDEKILKSNGIQGGEKFSKSDRHFTLKVKPLLSEKCFGCHGDPNKKLKGGLDLTSRESFMRGGEEFPQSLVPGDLEKSLVLKMIRREGEEYHMPPKENDRLTESQINDFTLWIAEGAPWPDISIQAAIRLEERSRPITDEGALINTSGGLSDEWTYRRYPLEDVWAFQPLKNPPLPDNSANDNKIDAFVLSELKEAGIEPSKTADPKTLIRRATYDLTGLPPTKQEIDQFLHRYELDADRAWENLIDRLLASPHYGEQWAKHWLDVARYADTGGYSNDYERSNAWRYRDYVIRSFNEDKPYDRFVIEQVAGDELADLSLKKRVNKDAEFANARMEGRYNSEESEWLVASSFLRMGPWDPAMVKAPEARQLYIDDVINSVGETFLSTTMRCFKCHDHKFDPLPTRDYYRFYAAFATTQLAERPTPFLDSENRNGFHEGKERVMELLEFARTKKNHLVKKREDAARAWFSERGLPYVSHNDRNNLPDDEKPPRHVGLNHVEQGQLKVREQDEWIWNRRLERYQPMVQSVYNGPDPAFLNARKLRIKTPGKNQALPVNFILSGGALEAKGERVYPGVLSAVQVATSTGNDKDPFLLGESPEGRRLELARWIAHPENGLALRSIVNRIWQYHFGQGIAKTPNNLGVKGAKPTHPELLDWLVQEFLNHDRQFKPLHKMIMMSSTYRQSSERSDRNQIDQVDPDNKLLSYFPVRRLSAEEVRDTMLAATGEMNPEMGGVPVMPEMNMEVALQPRMIQFSIAPAYQPMPTPEERNRRSIYMYKVRGQADPFLETFNQPSPNESCASRDASSISPQAFSLLNSTLVNDRANALAVRIHKLTQNKSSSINAAVSIAFQSILGRKPEPQEHERMVDYLKAMVSYHQEVKPEPATYPTSITRSLVEEFSGRPFEYEEILPNFRNYKADIKADQMDAPQRALSDLCLVLFNTHEFMYVY